MHKDVYVPFYTERNQSEDIFYSILSGTTQKFDLSLSSSCIASSIADIVYSQSNKYDFVHMDIA